ncbi:hypothetical protein MFRU_006g03470 [Monilinia fructicola]|nr:hypothetical protein MFRU_006g03470 [Monilinia fructicola]
MATGNRKKWKTLKQALKSVWSEKELTTLMHRLALSRDSTDAYSCKSSTDSDNQKRSACPHVLKSNKSLDSSTQTIITALLKHGDEVDKSV